MTESTPLAAAGRKGRVRARVWQDALAAHRAGRVRVSEVRAADFVGPGAQSAMGERIVRRVRQGKNVSVLGRADRPHTWSFTGDVARMLVTAGTDPRAWGRAWHVPSNEPLSQRQVIGDFARAAGVGQVRVGETPSVLLAGLELAERLDLEDGAGVVFGLGDVDEGHLVVQPEGGVPEAVGPGAVQFGVDGADEFGVGVGLVGLGPVADDALRHD